MAKFMNKALLLAAVQTGAGVDAAPTGALNAIRCRSLNWTPMAPETASRNLIRPYFGNGGQITVANYAQVEFEVELSGAGSPGVAPKWGPLLRGCAFSETITEDTDVQYTPVSGDIEMLTMYYYLDGLLHKMVDARGTVSFDISAKGIPFMRYQFMGAYTPVTDGSNPANVDYSDFLTPVGVNKANTPQWSIHGYTGCLQSLTVDVANTLVWRALIGCEGAEITNRAPAGNVVMELPTIAQLDWANKVISNAEGPLTITHGTVAGNIIQLSAPKAQLASPTYSDQDGIAMLNASLVIQPDAGNDELVITVK